MERTLGKIDTTISNNITDASDAISFNPKGLDIDNLLEKEYLLTNTRGGYSSSTVVGCNSRRYHGLLIGAMDPPANRIVGLSTILETLLFEGQREYLSTFEFNEKIYPNGYEHIKSFRRDEGVHFGYEVNGTELSKSVYLMRNEDTILICYDFKSVSKPFDFILRPMAAMRDFHSLQSSHAHFQSMQLEGDIFICHDVPGSYEMLLNCEQMDYTKDPQWWFSFVYRKDHGRGQDFIEDLWGPGFFKCEISDPCRIVLKAHVGNNCRSEHLKNISVESVVGELKEVHRKLFESARAKDAVTKRLVLAADQFICKRNLDEKDRATILAGYPWFFDWGRDAFISLPGSLLATGRFEEAKSVLTTFAGAVDEGVVPNRFDDRSHTAHFNSIDASLWFINAAFEYVKVTSDGTTFTNQLLPVIHWIVSSYQNGTSFDIHADDDGLIMGGNEDTQLTWMDAKFGGIAFTPRYGKAVEVNALWYNALSHLSKYYATWDLSEAGRFDAMVDKVGDSFREKFWNEETGYLNDCIYPDGSLDTSCRCNQIMAVSLEFSPLNAEQQKRVVEVVEDELLTPYGLRTLSRKDANYHGRYEGPQRMRDEAYHQGTVWAYFIGPFIEAYLKVNGHSPQSRERSQEIIQPLIEFMSSDGCLGGISEIFDGDSPHQPRGCFSQAWSVAEILRAMKLI